MTRVFIYYAGGTIGMTSQEGVLQPNPELGQTLLDIIQAEKLNHSYLSEVDIHIQSHVPLLDSCDMVPSDWYAIAQVIADKQDDYDGFIILHGTDTLAYTASALSFMLINLGKPVVLTGSMTPLNAPVSDAIMNFKGALLFATVYKLHEVTVFFGSKLLRGNRCTKIDCLAFNAFDSPNYPALGCLGSKVTLNSNFFVGEDLGEKTSGVYQLPPCPGPVMVFQVVPGFRGLGLMMTCLSEVRGIILVLYGNGGAACHTAFLKDLETLDKEGCVICGVSENSRGSVDFSVYASGPKLEAAGVIGLRDMTLEAAFTKLSCLVSQNLRPADIKDQMLKPLAGEMCSVNKHLAIPIHIYQQVAYDDGCQAHHLSRVNSGEFYE